MRYSIHLQPTYVFDNVDHKDVDALREQSKIRTYLESKGIPAAFYPQHRVIKFQADNPGIIKHLKANFAKQIVCVLSDKAGEGRFKRLSCHLTPKLFGSSAVALTPGQVAKAYNFPAPTAAIKDKTVAILELGGGFNLADVADYCKSQNVPVPRMWQHNFSTGNNTMDGADGADGEVSLDIDVVAATAPGVQILIIFAPNSTNGFIDAISNITTYFKHPEALSISWGSPEGAYLPEELEAMNNAIQACVNAGINVFVAAGDNGSSDGATGNNVDFPASSPFAIACGGTKLILNKDGSRRSEVVWNDLPLGGATGGGVSTTQTENYGGGIGPVSRTVPDIAGNADPNSGYIVNVDGQTMSIGGTSAVAPLMAALNVVLNSNLNQPLKNLRDIFYANPGVFFDVTSGNNGAYHAKSGYDNCTGLGVPDGQKLLAVVKPSVVQKFKRLAAMPTGEFMKLKVGDLFRL